MNENAISPVVGVMLMLVVTIIIAAVVSGFAGGLVDSTQKAPQLVMDVSIKNTGHWQTSFILFDVKSLSEPIPTKDLRIATSWRTNGGVSGGNVTAAGLNAPNTMGEYHSPIGYGKGITLMSESSQKLFTPYDVGQHFGNYTLMGGTTMRNGPTSAYWETATSLGDLRYQYRPAHGSDIDAMQAILGANWNATRSGDVVDVRITHLPSGKVIFTQSVVVQG